MTPKVSDHQTLFLVCRCGQAQVFAPEAADAVAEGLRKAGAAVTVVDDLCGLAARQDPLLGQVAQGNDVRIAACFPRAVRWLFHRAGANLPADAIVGSMRTRDTQSVVTEILSGAVLPQEALAATPPEDDWAPWFPVIDYGRCTNCRQCLNFCLFGVYGKDETGRVEVIRPRRCKTNCPACARICPVGAIIFPKIADRPINGDEVTPEDLRRPDMAVDPGVLRSGNVLQKLRLRSSGPPKDLGIPPEVLDEVSRKHAEGGGECS